MPRSVGIPPDEARDIEFDIKKQVANAGSTMADTIKKLNEKYGTNDTHPTVTRQLKQGNIPYWKILRIADVLGYEVKWVKKDK
jgi:hypothetical protein